MSVLRLVSPSRGVVIFVWGVWAVMVLVALTFVAIYGRNIPLSEDWLLVAPLTGNEPNLAAWIWEQNAEHRVPLPKLVFLVLLKLTGGDFRAGMFFNVLTLGALASSMILVARHVRGGRTAYTDAFFPIALLHLGNWENLAWSWQLSFVLPTVLTCTILLVIVGQKGLLTPLAALIAGVCLILLPLCGANGLIVVPPLAIWVGYSGVLHCRLAKQLGARPGVGLFLLLSAATGLLLIGIYFIGYERPWWNLPSPSIGATIKTSAKFLALSFGPAAAGSWWLSTLGVAGVLLLSAIILVAKVLRTNGSERVRALGLFLFLSSIVILALAVGWGRAGQGPRMPIRYGILAVQGLCAAYFIVDLYGPPSLRNAVLINLLVVMCILMPLNIRGGFYLRDWYREGMDAFERDLKTKIPRSVLAERHHAVLLHWDQEGLAFRMQMLHQAGIGLFRQMQEDADGGQAPMSSGHH